jgi:hypothetical protein
MSHLPPLQCPTTKSGEWSEAGAWFRLPFHSDCEYEGTLCIAWNSVVEPKGGAELGDCCLSRSGGLSVAALSQLEPGPGPLILAGVLPGS